MARLIIGCMDRRLNGFFDERAAEFREKNPGEDVFIIRNAGGNVDAAAKTIAALIKSGKVTEIHVYAHTDCGAMKFAMAVCAGRHVNKDLRDTIVKPFLGKDKKYASLTDIEQESMNLQTAALSGLAGIFPKVSASCKLVDVAKLNIPKSDTALTLIIGMAFSGKYAEVVEKYALELDRVYFVQSNHLEENRPSVELAVRELGIHKVMFVSNRQSEDRIVDRWTHDRQLSALFEREHIRVPPIKA